MKRTKQRIVQDGSRVNQNGQYGLWYQIGQMRRAHSPHLLAAHTARRLSPNGSYEYELCEGYKLEARKLSYEAIAERLTQLVSCS